jgi:hypothetical protein
VVVDVLQGAGLGHVLPKIAADLSNKGLSTLASALAAKAIGLAATMNHH